MTHELLLTQTLGVKLNETNCQPGPVTIAPGVEPIGIAVLPGPAISSQMVTRGALRGEPGAFRSQTPTWLSRPVTLGKNRCATPVAVAPVMSVTAVPTDAPPRL